MGDGGVRGAGASNSTPLSFMQLEPVDFATLRPPRSAFLPYGHQSIDDADVAAVVACLRSDWLTTGPRVAEFEAAFAQFCGAPHAVAVSSGTAALHAAMAALDVGPGDEVIVPPSLLQPAPTAPSIWARLQFSPTSNPTRCCWTRRRWQS